MVLSLPCEVNELFKQSRAYGDLIYEALVFFIVQSREPCDGSALTTNDGRYLTESLSKNKNREFQVTETEDKFIQFALLALAELIGTIIYEQE